MHYFDYISLDLKQQILIYLDIKYIKVIINNVKDLNIILSSKIFWNNKFKYDDLKEFIPFIDNNILIKYNQFMKINDDIMKFIRIFKKSNKYFDLKIKNEITLKELINLVDINKIKYYFQIDYYNDYKILSFFYNNKTYEYMEEYKISLTEKEFKMLLIRLYLSEYKVCNLGTLFHAIK